ncbi:MAG: tRNA (N6-threonylcarbamoyladenosine(37)-N6)-methyltransferase TrmO [Victivallales bacterium]|jgi:tRNA-Thr(GGU) m(6)t(6)A37 methyltransferase TsaA|nr:tRNA (N6-threonylcarbamoyladenosine(37)-N6)-methyltransferase TrmO [Victivallales bacterium]
MSFTFEPIGFVKSGGGTYPQESPRQAVFAQNEGVIELLPGYDFEQALTDLAGFERIWLIFVFDRNENWKPKVSPPDGSGNCKRGVFATRSPHRPNPIGISAVELIKIEGRKLFIRNFDLLDKTPILDIKPYIPKADAFLHSRAGWRDQEEQTQRAVTFSPESEIAAGWIVAHGGPDLKNVANIQLGNRELNAKRQRIEPSAQSGHFILAFRTWRLEFSSEGSNVHISTVFSGYTESELALDAPDPYCDKALHREFNELCSRN